MMYLLQFTALTVKKQNHLTFNKYLCSQCYIHVLLYIGTQVWVWKAENYLLKTQNRVFGYCSQMHGGS